MDSIKDFINRHKWLVTIFSIIFIGLPQYIDSVWGLAEKMLGRNIAMSITWAYWITVPLGIVMFCIAIWAIRTKSEVKPSLGVVVNRVKLDDSPKPGWVVFSISMTLEPSKPISLSKLDLDYSPELSIYPLPPAMKGPYPPMGGLPTELVERIVSYEIKYEVPGEYGRLLIDRGTLAAQKAPDSKWPKAHLHVMAGGFDFTIEPFLIPTPERLLSPDTGGFQT